MKLLAIPDEIRKSKQNLLNKFMSQQVKMNEKPDDNLRYLPISIPKNLEETIYRRNGKTVDKIHEFDFATGAKIQTTYYDYFNDKKIRSIDEFDIETGKLTRTTNYVLHKSVDEFDIESGKKVRTINYNLKDENRISSVQEYELEHQTICKVSIYRKDGISVSIIKELDPESGKVAKWTSFKEGSKKINSISEYDTHAGKPYKTTYYNEDGFTVKDVHKYNNDNYKNDIKQENLSKINYSIIEELDLETKEQMAKLIDNLFKKNHMSFEI